MRTYVVLALAIFATIAQSVFPEDTAGLPDIELQGICSYAIDCPNDSANVKIASIVGTDSKKASGDIMYCLMLTESPYKPSDKITGWPIYKAYLNPLPVGKQYANINTTQKIGEQPKTGKYYVTILLLEKRYGQYGFSNYVVFDEPIDYKNTKEDAINAKKAELSDAQKKYDYYYSGIQSTDLNAIYNNGVEAMKMLNTVSLIKSELCDLGYNADNPGNSTYIASPCTYKAYCLLVDDYKPSATVQAPAPAYAPAPSYTPSNSQQNSSSSGSGADSARNPLLLQYQQDLADTKQKLDQDQHQYDIDQLKDADSAIIGYDINHIEQDRKHIIFLEDLIYKVSSR